MKQNPYTVYDYTPSRSRDGPAKWLEGYRRLSASRCLWRLRRNLSFTENVTEVACWAHARRKFYDAQDSDERARHHRCSRWLAELYAIEREVKDADHDGAAPIALRRARSVPVLGQIKAWLDQDTEIVRCLRIPIAQLRSPMPRTSGQALATYVTQGFLPYRQ